MAGGGGFVSDMIKSIRNNRSLKQNSYYKGENYAARNPEDRNEVVGVSPAVLNQIRKKAADEEAAERCKKILVMVVSVVIVVLLSIVIFSIS